MRKTQRTSSRRITKLEDVPIGGMFKYPTTGVCIWRRVTEDEARFTGKEKARDRLSSTSAQLYVTPAHDPLKVWWHRTYYYFAGDAHRIELYIPYKQILKALL